MMRHSGPEQPAGPEPPACAVPPVSGPCGRGPLPDVLSAPPLGFPQRLLAAVAPWPSGARQTPCNLNPRDLRALCLQAPVPLLRLAYALCFLPPDTGAALLQLTLQAARTVLVADLRPPERNLEWPAALALRCLPGLWPGGPAAAYLRQGGLEGLSARVQARVVARRALLGGAAVLLRLEIGPGF
ncbi:hypothetical protein DW219_10705 [Desulfovibrio sp. AM18-2]|nr:hypothetical protein DW219_10705 [Desulfovibrio sp. AM18-2]